MNRRLVIICLALLWLAACTVGPNYKPPALPVEASYAPAGSPAAVKDLDAWWLSLSDPALTELIKKASDGNLELKDAEARIREARSSAAWCRARWGRKWMPRGNTSTSGSARTRRCSTHLTSPAFRGNSICIRRVSMPTGNWIFLAEAGRRWKPPMPPSTRPTRVVARCW